MITLEKHLRLSSLVLPFHVAGSYTLVSNLSIINKRKFLTKTSSSGTKKVGTANRSAGLDITAGETVELP